jgi:hypothetical protein
VRDDTYPAVVDIVLLVCGVVPRDAEIGATEGGMRPMAEPGLGFLAGGDRGMDLSTFERHARGNKENTIIIIQFNRKNAAVRLRRANGKAAYIRSVSR